MAQAQSIWNLGPMSQIQWIYSEWVKELGLMIWITANIELNDNQIQTRCIDINRLSVPGDRNYIYWLQLNTETIWTTTMFSFSFFRSFLHDESFTLYILIWIIFTLHLLIIRTLTWVLVLLDTLSGFLWVVVAEVVLFRGLLHINAARKVAAVNLMR